MLEYAMDGGLRNLAAASGMGPSPRWEFAPTLESSRLVFRIAFGVLRQREDAEDVAQDVFLKAYRTFHQLRDRENFHAWLGSIARRLAIDRYRKDRRRMASEGVAPETFHDEETSTALIHRERVESLRRAIDALPQKLRVVVRLADIEEHDIREVARVVGIPEGTVRSRLFTGRRRLKELLQGLKQFRDREKARGGYR